jgi:uncharacterized membrane protein YGL010W
MSPPARFARRWTSVTGGRTSEQWIAQYATSHQHPVNRFCHTLGIPLIVISIGWFAIAWITSAPLLLPVTLFLIGWALQFLGHAFEGKRPEFFQDWRFLFVGLRWWVAKMRGRA